MSDDNLLAGIKVALKPLKPGSTQDDLDSELLWCIRNNFDHFVNYEKWQANNDGPVRDSHKLGDEVKTALNALALATAKAIRKAVTELPSHLELKTGELSDLSKVEFDVLERIYTAVGAEMGRRGANTNPGPG